MGAEILEFNSLLMMSNMLLFLTKRLEFPSVGIITQVVLFIVVEVTLIYLSERNKNVCLSLIIALPTQLAVKQVYDN